MKPSLFNPTADDSKKRLYGGETTNLFNLVDLKYKKFKDLYYKAYGNNWLPDEVSNMAEDKMQYANALTPEERKAYNLILSYLVFLDSVQTNNLPNIADFITDPEVKLWLSRQDYDESNHSLSYGYILTEMLIIDEAKEIIYLWRDDPVLFERIKYIAELYEENKDKDDVKAFLILLIANYMLEGIYFYNGFMFFHNLAYRGLMTASNTQIAYIKRDELLHCVAFADMIRIFKEENPEDFDEKLVYDLFKKTVEQELRFGFHAIGDDILGMSKQTIEDYTYYLANMRLKQIGLEPIFPNRKNPYKHLDKYASVDDETSNTTNIFEKKSIQYKQPEMYKGWNNVTKYRKHKLVSIFDRLKGA